MVLRRFALPLLLAALIAPAFGGCSDVDSGSNAASAYTAEQQVAIRAADAKRDAGLPVWCKIRNQGWVDGKPADCPMCVDAALKELAASKEAGRIASKEGEAARGPKCSCESCESGKTNHTEGYESGKELNLPIPIGE